MAWTNDANGSPLGYSSDYFFRFIVSICRFAQPELVLWLLLITLFSVGAYGVYLIARRNLKAWPAFLLGLAAFVNPAIFYKFTAGHIDYLMSYDIFIYLVYFLYYRFKPTTRSACILGLLLALIGVQIQFFVIAGLLIGFFFIFRPDLWRWRFLVPLIALPILINIVWLSNFLFGGADLASISGEATKASFNATSSSNYLNIFSFSFSQATLISKFYSFYELLLYGLSFTLLVVVLLRARRKKLEDVSLLLFLLVMLFLATGLFQAINLGFLTTLYPMFREVGHFAPVVVLVLLVLMARLMPSGLTKWLSLAWLVVIVIISFGKYQSQTQSLNFGAARQEFAEFKQFSDTHKSPEHRILAYPFFDQYAFVNFPMSFQNSLPMRNSGHDSFTDFFSGQYVQDAIKPQDFKQSLQYRLLKTLDISVLKSYNVQYIYDFSSIYESYYDRYVPSSTYDNDLSLIKNNPDFLQQLAAANPGKLRQLGPHIWEITDARSRVASIQNLYNVTNEQDGESSRSFMESVFPNQTFDYVSETAKVPPSTGQVTSLFSATQENAINVQDKSLSQKVDAGGSHQASLYSNRVPDQIFYKATKGVVTFYAKSSGKLYQGGRLIQDDDALPPQQLGQIQLGKNGQYYAGINGDIIPLNRDGGGSIGRLTSSSVLQLYTTVGDNSIANPSFESGLWGQQVGDCNNFDSHPDIAMKLDTQHASDGRNSLELLARRHDACTSTRFGLKNDTTYLLSYDYQSPNAQTASFYLRFNSSDQNAIKRFQGINDSAWHTTNQLIITPSDATTAQLFVHAIANNSAAQTINRYDNFKFVELKELDAANIALPNADYTSRTVQVGQDSPAFRFVDDRYDYANVIKNGSFEDGLWQSQVTDCDNYDSTPVIGMSLNKASSTDGKQSLELDATRHAACAYTNVNVKPATTYALSFDYRGNSAKQAGYYVEFSGNDNGPQQRIDILDNKWHTYSTEIQVPNLTDSLRLYLHAYESNGSSKNVVLFDNVKLIALPSVDQRFYVVSQPDHPLVPPQNVSFQAINTTKKTALVTGAKGSFVLSLSESYHSGWRLELDDNKLHDAPTWLPGVSVHEVADHFKINNYANAWYIDPAVLCESSSDSCTKHSDGSYDIKLVAEFVPERWFVVNRTISISTLVLVTTYIAVSSYYAKKYREDEGVYRHIALRSRRNR